jgi:hypothetical protein
MIVFKRRAGMQWAWCVGFLMTGLLASPALQAENIKVEAKLIWGTNDEKSPHPMHKPVEEALAEKLRRVFKWKNYFLEKQEVVEIASRQTRTVRLSKDCEVEITEMPGTPIQVKLIGKGKVVNKTTKPLVKGELFVLGGDDANQSAWFVVIEQK